MVVYVNIVKDDFVVLGLFFGEFDGFEGCFFVEFGIVV